MYCRGSSGPTPKGSDSKPSSQRAAGSAMSPMPIAPAGSIEIRTATEIQSKADARRIDIRIGIRIRIGIGVRVRSGCRHDRRRTVELPLQFSRRARVLIELLLQRAHLRLL